MTAQLNTQTCGVSMKHDPHGFVITTQGITPWLVVCAGHGAQNVTPIPVTREAPQP